MIYLGYAMIAIFFIGIFSVIAKTQGFKTALFIFIASATGSAWIIAATQFINASH